MKIMLYQRMRSRFFRVVSGPELTFPCSVEVLFKMTPPWMFGAAEGKTRSRLKCVKDGENGATAENVYVDYHRGVPFASPEVSLRPLSIEFSQMELDVRVDGDTLHVTLLASSQAHLEEILGRIYYQFPILLNVDAGDAPAIMSVIVRSNTGTICEWVPRKIYGAIFPTSQQRQQQVVEVAVRRAVDPEYVIEPRLQAAIEYFYSACRLISAAETPGEFAGEAVLNFAKVLEALFPAQQDVGTIDSARAGLAALGYPEVAIECHFVPAIALRNHLGIGHAKLVALADDSLEVVQAYVAGCENPFRQLMMRLLDLPIQQRDFLKGERAAESKDLKKLLQILVENRQKNALFKLQRIEG